MNFEPFAPFEASESLPPCATDEPRSAQHYFDRPGVVWIVACLLFAIAAARLLPWMSEPDAWHQSLVAIGWAEAGAAHVTGSSKQDAHQRQEATRAVGSEQADARPVPALLRQF